MYEYEFMNRVDELFHKVHDSEKDKIRLLAEKF